MYLDKYFYKSQRDWILDDSPLKIVVKSRQAGFSFANDFRLVLLVSAKRARLDAYIVSRDLQQACLQLEDCLHWAEILHLGATPLGEIVFDANSNSSAHVLQFANGRRIYSLSSNPNGLAGKRGHVTLDEFALHPDQRLLYRVAKPVTTWGGQLSIISTHRGPNTLFHQIITAIQQSPSSPIDPPIHQSMNPLIHPAPTGPSIHQPANPPIHSPFGARWSLHQVPIQKAVAEGLLERINKKTGRSESRDAFLHRLRAECIDEEQWLQEYCCIPADENSAFFSHDMLDACTDPALRLMDLCPFLQSVSQPLPNPSTPPSDFFLGMDVGRSRNLCVIDLGEKIGPVIHDRLRLELHDKSFTEIEASLFPLLALPRLRRACIDSTGMGLHLSERARERFGWKIEPVNFTAPLKEELAFALRRDFEDRSLRIPPDDQLRADLRALKKEVTPAGKLRFIGQVENSHCDRTWAKALRQHAARHRPAAGALVV